LTFDSTSTDLVTLVYKHTSW